MIGSVQWRCWYKAPVEADKICQSTVLLADVFVCPESRATSFRAAGQKIFFGSALASISDT